MKYFFKNLNNSSKERKRRFATTVSVVATAIIFFVWVSILVTKPFGSGTENVASGVTPIRSAIGTFESVKKQLNKFEIVVPKGDIEGNSDLE